jgi:hypothetical protein
LRITGNLSSICQGALRNRWGSSFAALRKIHDVADDKKAQPDSRELTEAGELLVKGSSDVPRTAPVDQLQAIVIASLR